MTQFMLAYHGGNQPNSKEEGMAHMEKWKTWVKELGETIMNPGTPLAKSKLLTPTGIQDDQSAGFMKGFAVIKAENIEAAIEIAKTDPFLLMGGTIRVSQMIEMP